MSNVLRFPDLDRIEEQASEWVAWLDSGSQDEARTRKLHEWLRQEPRHRKVLVEMAELMDRLSVLSKVSELFPLEEQAFADQNHGRHFGSGSYLRLATAGAAGAVILGVVLWSGSFSKWRSADDQFSTGTGDVRAVELADGSRVTLNTRSHIDVRFDPRQRKVLLGQGEALFEVARDRTRPFLVEAGGNLIRAVGTAFNVQVAKAGIEVTVTEGVVEIATHSPEGGFGDSSSKGTDAALASPPQATRVVAGQVARIERSIRDLRPIDSASVDAKLAWKRGELIFTGEPLQQVIAEVGRYTDRAIVITDDRIAHIPIGGHFAAGDIDNLLDILDHGFGVEVTRTGSGAIYLSKREAQR